MDNLETESSSSDDEVTTIKKRKREDTDTDSSTFTPGSSRNKGSPIWQELLSKLEYEKDLYDHLGDVISRDLRAIAQTNPSLCRHTKRRIMEIISNAEEELSKQLK